MIHTVFVKCGQVGRVTCLRYLGHSRRFKTQPRAWESCRRTSLQEASKSKPPLSGKEGGFPISEERLLGMSGIKQWRQGLRPSCWRVFPPRLWVP